MTFKEKLQMEHPWMNETITDVVIKELCPCDLGYEKRNEACHHYRPDEECIRCWNREMPYTELVKTVTLPMPPNTDKPFTEKEVYEEAGYNKGLNDAWKLAEKIWSGKDNENVEIFGTKFVYEIYQLSPQEAIAKLKVYEEAQIEVGDVVIHTVGTNLVLVTKTLDNNYFEGINEFGSVYSYRASDEWKKTGKHIDISSILEQIGE